MSDRYVRLIVISQKTERLLEQRFGAKGRGLHEKLSSVADKIPERVQRKIRFIATVRNRATHEDVAVAKKSFPDVRKAFLEILPFLDGGESRRKALRRKILIVAGLVFLAALYFLFFR